MEIIYKYELIGPHAAIDLPIGAQVLTVQMQGDQLVLWALIDQQEIRTVQRQFIAVNTGVSFDVGFGLRKYIGTATTENGIVWHVFEVSRGPA